MLVLGKQDVTMQALNIHLRGSHLLVLDKQDSDQVLNICKGVTSLYWSNKIVTMQALNIYINFGRFLCVSGLEFAWHKLLTSFHPNFETKMQSGSN